VLTSTIDKYCHVLARYMPPYLGTRYRIAWSKFETVDRRDDIQHAGVRGCLEYLGIDKCFEVNHAGDLPARSGIGSSSAFTVAMLNALHALEGRHVNKAELARQAIEVEQVVLKETVGIQDQIECAHGGLNFIQIRRDGSYDVHPIILSADRLHALQSHCMLFFTGLVRNSSDVAKSQIDNLHNRVQQIKDMMKMAEEGLRILADYSIPIEQFGELLHEGWLLKRGMSALVTNYDIDAAYSRAMSCGAIGGKLLGAGGGGFMLVFARPEDQARIRESVGMLEVPVAFESTGSQIIHSS
jgi:D-glycero-alpha-D-manno-heptose-7-phosphate kinase